MNAATIGAIVTGVVAVIGAIASLIATIQHRNDPNAHK